MTRLAIYGSCVSRDTFEHLGDDFALTTYVARQSLISATTPAVEPLPVPALESRFQARAVVDDFGSRAIPRLASAADQTDLLVLDLTDERLGVLAWQEGRWVTDSSELRRSGLLRTREKQPTRVAFGTPRHQQLWTVAVQRFAHRLRHIDLFERTVVLRTPWASTTVQGNQLPPVAGRPVPEMNRLHDAYYAVLADAGFPVLELPAHLAVSDETHRWTAAPYHYHVSAYEHLAVLIRRHAAELRTRA